MRDQTHHAAGTLVAQAEDFGQRRMWDAAESLLRDVLETAPEDPAAARALAEVLRQQGRWTEAAALLEAWLARDPDDAQARASLAGVRLAQGRVEACLDEAAKALAFAPQTVAAHCYLALGLLRKGDLPSATKAINTALHLAPEHPEVLLAQGLIQTFQGQPQAAEANFRRILSLDQAHPEAKANLAALLVKQGEARQAQLLLGEALAIKPFLEGALHLQGKLLAAAGDLEAASASFEQLLAVNPEHVDAQRRLATILRVVGASAGARRELEALAGELEARPTSAELWTRRASALCTLQQREQAFDACEKALQLSPHAIDARLLLARLHLEAGAPEEVRVVLAPLNQDQDGGVEIQALLARANFQLHRFAEAEALLRTAIECAPARPDLLTQLGETLGASGRPREALAAFSAALAQDPDRPDTLYAQGKTLKDLGDPRGAIASYEQALKHAPRSNRVRQALAQAYLDNGRFDEAEALLREVLARAPLNAGLYCNLGTVLMTHKRLAEAEQHYQRAIDLEPGLHQAHAGMAHVYRHQHRLSESIASSRQALALKPEQPSVLVNLGTALLDQGKVTEAIDAYNQAISIDERCAVGWSNRLLALNYLRQEQPAVVAQAHFAFGAQFEDADDGETGANPVAAVPPPARLRATGEALRVGYISGDLYDHSCAYFIESLWRGHRREQVELFCYSHTRREDATTARLKALVDHWAPILGMSDSAVLKRVAMDGIDLLVDLNGHAGENRLPVFAKRAAPVQLNWLGYPNTTGLRNMDYRITDAWADPPGWTEPLHAETLVRLPGGFLCYTPDARAPAPSPPPVRAGRPLTFGCFNNPTKIGAEAVAVWAQLLRALPGARMAFKARHLQDRGAAERLLKLFADQGVDASRLVLRRPQADKGEHLGTYNLIDIALDTFPYHGTTTTCEALWMGVPVITLVGEVHVSRVGVSLLKQVGLDALIALTPAEYIAKARALATDHARLTALRAGLRERMAASPLCDAERFAREMEAAYRWMCERQRADRLD